MNLKPKQRFVLIAWRPSGLYVEQFMFKETAEHKAAIMRAKAGDFIIVEAS